jgi:hypothetical protein
MVKPVDSKSPHRPLRQDSVGREVKLKATIIRSGHTSSVLKVGANEVTLGNANLREVTGIADL